MLTIRLSRVGKKNKPMYRLIISEKARDPYGKALEILGSYNPHNKELLAKNERIKYWLSRGSQMSPTVNNLLIDNGVIEGAKIKASKTKKRSAEEKKQEKQQNNDPNTSESSAHPESEGLTATDNKTEENEDKSKETDKKE